MHICVFAVICLISVSFFSTDVLSHCGVFLCQSLCCGHAVREYSTSFTETGFPPSSLSSSFPLSHRHSSSGPLGMQTRCSWWFLLWAELRYSVIYDLAFSSFSRTKPDSHARKWWEPQNAEKIAIFFRSFSQTPKTPDIFSSPATLLCYSLHWFFPFSVPHTLPLFSIIYTFKHEICLIHCEGSQ